MSDKENIATATYIIASATLLSRILGYIRDAVIAAIFGAGFHTDIFFVAFRIPNFFRRLVGEGALTASLVPVFTEEVTKKGRERGNEFASKVFTLFTIIFIVLTVAGILFSKELVEILAPGFVPAENKFILTVSVTRWMFPFLFFIGLLAVAMGILNSLKHFFAPAISPVFFNISIILSVIFLYRYFAEPVYALAFGVVIGGLFQFIYQLPYIRNRGISLRPKIDLYDPAIRKVLLLMGPYALGVAVYQINIFITQWFASSLAEGSISYLYYANRLVELPLGVFGISIATAVLPSMSEYAARREWGAFREAFSLSIRLVNFITIPSMIGLIVLGPPIITILFQHGEFNEIAARKTTYALYFYSLGLTGFAGTRIAASAFYSLKDTFTPVIAAVASVLANLLFCLLLVKPLKYGGLALATSIASFINYTVLLVSLKRRTQGIAGEAVIRSASKVLLASIFMGLCVFYIDNFTRWHTGGEMWRIIILLIELFLGAFIFLFSAYLLKINELNIVTDLFPKRSGRKENRRK